MPHNWLEDWERNYIPFHSDKVNSLLEKYWPQLCITTGENVFVPLCGKTKDLLWLANQGLYVTGVELSPIACKTFFIENQLEFNTQIVGSFIRYYNKQIELFCGDFFALSKSMVPAITAVYDRAALIALPETLQHRYVQHLLQLMTPKAQMLLVVLDSSDEVQGPPYPVSYAKIEQLFGQEFQITQLELSCETEISNHLVNKGYRKIQNMVYNLKRQRSVA